jgi:hypothetical protein
MVIINKDTLDMETIRGNTASFAFKCTNKTNNLSMFKDGDTVYFTIRKIIGGNAILQKTCTTFPDGICTIEVTPQETQSLDEGNYIYDLLLERASGEVDTLNPNRKYSNYSVKKGVKNE